MRPSTQARPVMIKIKNIVIFTIISLVLPGITIAQEQTEPDYYQFTDIIYEWSTGGSMIQVGDQTISRIKSVWIDRGDVDDQGKSILYRSSSFYIKLGSIATPMMLEKDRDGNWIAEKLIIYSGKGLEAIVKQLPLAKQKEFINL